MVLKQLVNKLFKLRRQRINHYDKQKYQTFAGYSMWCNMWGFFVSSFNTSLLVSGKLGWAFVTTFDSLIPRL